MTGILDSEIFQDVKIALEILLLTLRHLHLKHFVKKKINHKTVNGAFFKKILTWS